MKNIAIVPGSFDPCSNGHLDIIKRAAKIFDIVIVAVLTNSKKSPAFTASERVAFLQRVLSDVPNIQVESFSGLLVDYANQKGAHIIVKGLRAVSDFEYEFQMALANRKISGNLETIFLTASSDNMYLSSGIIREIAKHGGNISGMVPEQIENDIYLKLNTEGK